MAKLSEYLMINEAAAYLGVSKDTLRRWDAAGKLTARRHPISGFRLYLQADLDRLLASVGSGKSKRSRPKKRKKSG